MSNAADQRSRKVKRDLAPVPAVQTLPTSSVETTDLERRVLAHERVLQALIAYMSRAEPRFVDHLRKRFVEPMNLARTEHDYRDSDDYAAEFIRAVMLLGETTALRPPKPGMAEESSWITREKAPRLASSPSHHDRVQVTHKSGIWHVTLDGAFRGDYREEEHARATAAILRMSLQ
jgi:hypothetical protein